MSRRHGVAPAVHEEAATRRTARNRCGPCPLVSKVHKEARRLARDELNIVLIGHQDHEEVIGLQARLRSGLQLHHRPEDVAALEVSDPDRVAFGCPKRQLSVDETMDTVAEFRFPISRPDRCRPATTYAMPLKTGRVR